jgi:putative ABC transport system permease protein
MPGILSLALRSAWNRRTTLAFIVAAMVLATILLLSVTQARRSLHESFSQAVNGTDLIVGARGSNVQLLLYAVFHIGDATQNMSWASAQKLARHPAVAWSIPLSLGDSHRGFPVLATSQAYFEHLQVGHGELLQFSQGRMFNDVYDAVIGSEVAQRLGYAVGQRITLTHGAVAMPGAAHADKPFRVVGVLAPTGTPVDRTVHITLAGMEAIHLDWQAGAPLPGMHISAEAARRFDLTPKTITAQLLGLKRRSDVFAMQRAVADEAAEPLMGVLPGVTLDQLWELAGRGEQVLMGLAWVVAVAGIAGMVATLLASLQARRRELAILRAVGAGPWEILALLGLEGLGVTLAGMLLGVLLTASLLPLMSAWLEVHYGISLAGLSLDVTSVTMLALLLAGGVLGSLIPGVCAWRMSLSEGLAPRV